ncbi:hypothetical protein, partial [Bifidobacterium mongoliense]
PRTTAPSTPSPSPTAPSPFGGGAPPLPSGPTPFSQAAAPALSAQASTCPCMRAEADLQPTLIRLASATTRATDGLRTAGRASDQLDWTGPAASYFRDRIDELSRHETILDDRVAVVRRLIAGG